MVSASAAYTLLGSSFQISKLSGVLGGHKPGIFICLVTLLSYVTCRLGTVFVIGGLVSRSIDKATSHSKSELTKGTLPALEAGEAHTLLADMKQPKQIPVISSSTPRAKPTPAAFSASGDSSARQGTGAFASPIRRNPIVPAFPGSGDWKEKPG